MDKRIEKTKKILMNTLVSLLNKKQFSEITVKEICEESLVSRITFYTHYEDKYDLLDYSVNQISKDIYNSFIKEYDLNIKQQGLSTFLTNFTIKIIELCFENKNILNHVFKDEGIEKTIITSCISKMAEAIFNKTIEHKQVNENKKNYILSFFIGGLTNLITDLFEEKNPILNDLKDELYYLYNLFFNSYIKSYA